MFRQVLFSNMNLQLTRGETHFAHRSPCTRVSRVLPRSIAIDRDPQLSTNPTFDSQVQSESHGMLDDAHTETNARTTEHASLLCSQFFSRVLPGYSENGVRLRNRPRSGAAVLSIGNRQFRRRSRSVAIGPDKSNPRIRPRRGSADRSTILERSRKKRPPSPVAARLP